MWPTCQKELISWKPVTHKSSAVGERRHWLVSKTSAIRLQVILGHKNALPNSISSGCNLANTLQAASRRKKKVRSLFLSERPEPLSWCVGGKKAAEGKLAALTWSKWLLEYMSIIIYAVSSVKAVLSILKMDEKLIASSQVYKISAAW